jgi:cation diffusion facilitator CzcD-associated flavoprotein CzcO
MMTRFSDLDYPSGTAVYPTNQQVQAYLEDYADTFGLTPHLRLGTRVASIDRAANGVDWTVRSIGADGRTTTEVFPQVVVASGRYNQPRVPEIDGLDTFSGAGGATHTFFYKDPDRYRGQRVLVAGGSISALEIASDLAMLGAAEVVVSLRRQRYVLQKIMAGVPHDHLAFTRFAALAGETFPMEAVGQGLKDFIVRTSGSPEQYGAPKPADSVFEAGATMCQHYLPLVAEGRIRVAPWIQRVDGQTVTFTDGTSGAFDAILVGTGFDLHLPFVSDAMRRTLNLDADHIDLHGFTFHPDLPGLAFVGLFELIGPYFPVLELQARWVAYAWSGACPVPSHEEMEAGVAAYRSRRGTPQAMPMHAAAVLFARQAGVEPVLQDWPELTRALLFGPLTPPSFRLSGPDRLPDAATQTAAEAAAFGVVADATLTPEQQMQLQALADARGDAPFSEVVSRVVSPEPFALALSMEAAA